MDGLWPTAQSTWRSHAHVHRFLPWEASGSENPSLAFPGTPLHGLFPNPFCIGRPCLIRTSCTDGKKGPLPPQSPAPASALSCFEPYPIEFCPHLLPPPCTFLTTPSPCHSLSPNLACMASSFKIRPRCYPLSAGPLSPSCGTQHTVFEVVL